MIFNGTTIRIPEELLLAHQEGKVVFFCGAGISCGAGIPLFDKLVLKSAKKAGASLTDEERRLLKRGGCDTVYQEIEKRVGVANRYRLRQATATPRFGMPPKHSCVFTADMLNCKMWQLDCHTHLKIPSLGVSYSQTKCSIFYLASIYARKIMLQRYGLGNALMRSGKFLRQTGQGHMKRTIAIRIYSHTSSDREVIEL